MSLQAILESRVAAAMTVGELIEELKMYDENDRVVFGYDYGDRCNTQVRQPVRYIDEQEVEYSEYHKSLKEVPEDNEDEDKIKAQVIVIS